MYFKKFISNKISKILCPMCLFTIQELSSKINIILYQYDLKTWDFKLIFLYYFIQYEYFIHIE